MTFHFHCLVNNPGSEEKVGAKSNFSVKTSPMISLIKGQGTCVFKSRRKHKHVAAFSFSPFSSSPFFGIYFRPEQGRINPLMNRRRGLSSLFPFSPRVCGSLGPTQLQSAGP